MKLCSISDCDRKHEGLGYCKLHRTRFKKHGDPLKGARGHISRTPEYVAWCNMKTRCRPENARMAKWYAARNIRVCPEWQHNFLAFLEHVGPRPSAAHSLDRIENDKGYEPGNVRWATMDVQGANQKLRSTNTTGYRGVSRTRYGYLAQITYRNQHFNLGRFATPEEAHAAYMRKALALRGF